MGIGSGPGSYLRYGANRGVSHGTMREFERLIDEEAERLAQDESFSDAERAQLIDLKKASLMVELGIPQMALWPTFHSYPTLPSPLDGQRTRRIQT